uniref:Dynein axonemal intermediate chain 7 n=1 Tax=Jaculus jaculus TaxID=51337 RepID=A0A8C5KMZ8_JACJA
MNPKYDFRWKKKISKEERLKLLQEEEERRLKEEEEARLKLEKEELERLEIQRIEDEKWHQLEEKDLERRSEEFSELGLLEGCFLEAERLKRDNRALSQWKHYTNCDGTPDPEVPQELNTFISLWKEETNEAFEAVIEKSKLVLSLIDKMKLAVLETPSYELEDRHVLQCQGSILELQELLHLKFDVATEILLRQASTLADLDSGNMEKIIQDENVTLYVWANLKKNPRYRTIRFSETQTGFEIPRTLAMSNIALRLLHTRYDHVTPLQLAVAETVPDKVDAEVAHPEEQQEVKAEEEHAGGGGGGEEEEMVEVQEEAHAAVPEEQPQVECLSGCWPEDCSEFEATLRLLSEFQVHLAHLFHLKNAVEKPDVTEESEVDLCQYAMLGGVYHLDILELPPQCKAVKGWIIVEIRKEGLQKFKYPPDATEEPDSENTFPPIEVTLEVCENVLFFEDPMIIRWDDKGKHWKKDGISDVLYNREKRLITFSLETLGPVTLIQDAHINMPYQSWELRPLDMNKVLLTVTTVFTDIQIHIKENVCMLASIKLKKRERLSNLEGKWMAPVPFIMALKNAGLNIFPTEYSHFYAIANNKVPVVEMRAYRQMALLSSAFAFGWSKWNLMCNSTKVIFKVKEHPTAESTPAPWALLMFSGDRAQALKMSEDSEVYSEALKEGTEFHSTLFHMAQDFASREAMQRVRDSSCLFIDSVCHMLLSIRVLSYS